MEKKHGEGRIWTLEGCAYSMEQSYACALHGVTAATCCTVDFGPVCWVHASRDCVTSVGSLATRPYYTTWEKGSE